MWLIITYTVLHACLCVLQTLMDPERRATYDALAGFSASSINPFVDTSLPADQVCDTCSCQATRLWSGLL